MNPFSEARRRHENTGGFGAALVHASLEAAERKFFPRPESRLIVDIDGAPVTPYDSARITMAVIDATAMFGRSLMDPQSPVTNVHPAHRSKVGLISAGSFGNSLHFTFPDCDTESDPVLFVDHVQTLAEAAAWSLVESLPRAVDDDDALDAVLSLPVTQRRGIEHLVNAVESTTRSLGVSVAMADGAGVSSTLSKLQADVLKDSLMESRSHARIITEHGILDGMRTRRRIFYLEREDMPVLHGSIADELIADLPKYLSKKVVATLEETTIQRASGVIGRPTYRLIRIKLEYPENELFSHIDI
ncbi:hypothetical protein DEU38_103128 [Rhodococcus sp. AG1013]|uniref:hypothetical protein n=1 Tax=Rhodococcus sp. AG1013 TaxID=2183996 RepID=UPI000E2ACE7B|nr:hypothetical protein [Rhodococcus sp. AG1013]RDI32395.1 hypothetical protein DEU38_103128 [Rhodococcus sp. AG1013]